jgi:endonuclease G
MKRFIRAHCDDYLADGNIASIGIGRKNGASDGEEVIQFAVQQKVRPESLESVSTKPIPAEIEFEGHTLRTDVVQRSFKPSFIVVTPEALTKDPRKQRLGVLVPGISIGNARTNDAGTLGAVVRDLRNDQPALLSNWHVLHTPDGQIGDAIVQPGPFDDNQIKTNVVGHLLRSHLGPAGDCAISSVESRRLDSTILDLKTHVGRIGKAELDDLVVKSGRTTGVTFGIVTRVETITKMNYGNGVVESIGGFEIGIDKKHKPSDGELSKGGDSGSCWMAVDERGRASDVMLGLHFAGDAEDSDAEFALACNAHSVFEKLEIAPSAEAAVESRATAEAAREDLRRGFDQDFLQFRIADVRLVAPLMDDLVRLDGRRDIRYCHFSVFLSKSRRFPRVVAWNIDGAKIKKIDRTGIPFIKDQRGALGKFQIGDELYVNNPIDRGHVARRADLCWGSMAEANQANRDSFFFSNITPQHQRFNQGQRNGIWGRLEDAIFEDVRVTDLKVSLLGGPILRKNDPIVRDIPIPVEFWKLIVFRDDADNRDKARAFILTQRNLLKDVIEPESLELDEFRIFQVPLTRIQDETGLIFTAAFRALDTMPAAPQGLGPNVREIASIEDLFA